MKSIITFIVLLAAMCTNAQTFGPRDAGVGANVAGAGSNNWTNAGNITTSNNSDATISTVGLSSYLQGRNFGFTVPATNVITGIQVDVEKSATFNDVALLNSWSATTTDRVVSNGQNRCLVVIIAMENATSRDVTSVTYGGLPLTLLTERDLFTTFYARMEVWYMMEAQLASGINLATSDIAFTVAGNAPDEYFDILSSAVYQNVDQAAPIFDTETSTRDGGGSTYQLGSAVNTLPGSMTIASVFCGNPPTPRPAGDATGSFDCFDQISATFPEQFDYHDRANDARSTGGALQVSHKLSAVVGTEQPTFSFNGTPNRLVAVGFSLRRARNIDNSVRLRKASGYTGTEKAVIGADWTTNDAYTTYGGPGDLWGTTWTTAEVNDPNFGLGLSVNLTNGTATVDHIRVTIFTANPLPVELTDFSLEVVNESVAIRWTTQSERDNEFFYLERSRDGSYWEELGKLAGAGNSSSKIDYEYLDGNPFNGVSYYRLRQVNTDGESAEVGFETVNFKAIKYLLYPTPVNNMMFLEGDDLANSEFSIVNSLGEMIEVERSFVGDNLSFNFSGIKSGVYFISITSENTKTTKRIIVAHK